MRAPYIAEKPARSGAGVEVRGRERKKEKGGERRRLSIAPKRGYHHVAMNIVLILTSLPNGISTCDKAIQALNITYHSKTKMSTTH